MPDSSPLKLICLSDEKQGVSLTVIGGMSFSGTNQYDALHAEILVSTGFVSGRVELYPNAYDLDSWTEALESLAAGWKATWLESGRSPRITIDEVNQPDRGVHRQMLAAVRSRFQLER
ncbi:DUF5959 family protein [Streptomyces albogriseolus]